MPNLTVYVPDDLAAKLKEAKDSGVEVNPSRLLQEGIRRALHRAQIERMGLRAADEEIDIGELVERIRRNRAEIYAIGRQIGFEWVRESAYAALAEMGTPEWRTYHGELHDERQDSEIIRHAMEDAEMRAAQASIAFDKEAARHGFLSAVEEVWVLLRETIVSDPPFPPLPSQEDEMKQKEDDDIPF